MFREIIPPALAFITIALALGSASPAAALVCHKESETITVSGYIVLRHSTSVHTGSPYTYPVLHLEKALCYEDKEFGHVPQGINIALIPSDDKAQHLFIANEGKRITVRGALEHAITADQPPQELLLFDPVVIKP
jgi:hypothetical protein